MRHLPKAFVQQNGPFGGNKSSEHDNQERNRRQARQQAQQHQRAAHYLEGAGKVCPEDRVAEADFLEAAGAHFDGAHKLLDALG